MIYLLSYVELLACLFLIDFFTGISKKKLNLKALKSLAVKCTFPHLLNFGIITGFIILSGILFKGFLSESAVLYQRIGIGMIPIAGNSFYWHMPVLFGAAFVLLISRRKHLPSRYFETGLLMLFLAIGNSMYFFGRSHENNIINISGLLIFVLFLLFDALKKKFVLYALPALLIASLAFFYSDRITGRVSSQYKNMKNAKFICPFNGIPPDLSVIKNLTDNSKKVYFLDYQSDFIYYYYGSYQAMGYYQPCSAWVFKSELKDFLQKLLSQDYYLVIMNVSQVSEIIPGLNYNHIVKEKGITVVHNESEKLLLPQHPGSIIHKGFKGDMGNTGIALEPISLGDNYTIELIVKPGHEQVANAKILSNAQNIIGPRGFAIQQNGNTTNQFMFAYGNGKSWIAPGLVKLIENEWNYLVITVKKDTVKIYSQAIPVYSGKLASPVSNSDTPLILGSEMGQNNRFNGILKELSITKDNITDQEIHANFKILQSGTK